MGCKVNISVQQGGRTLESSVLLITEGIGDTGTENCIKLMQQL